MRKLITPLLASAALAALGVTAAQAQQAAPPPAQAATATAGASVSDEKVESFAVAMVQVSQLNETYSAQLQAAADDAARSEIQQRAATEMAQAVEQAGISPEEYNQIAQQAQGDAELRARIGQAMQSVQPAETPAS
ncbi:MAG TPA: DUF4168 domain-containing protein [Phenylobacterium sp.]|nr:DUF4168 domain-containing protein [Phenylobacterium sp.]